MKVAIALLTCNRYEYTVKTVESLFQHNDPSDFLLFHGDDASTDPRVAEYVQSRGFKTVMQRDTMAGCSPATDELLHSVAKLVEPGALVLYLQNDEESLRPLPQQLLRDLLVKPEVAFVQLSSRRTRSRYARRMGWAFDGGQPWQFGDTTHEVVYSDFNRGMGFPPSISDIDTWLHAVKGGDSEKRFRSKTEYPDRRMSRLTRPVFGHIGKMTTPNGRFGRRRKNRRTRRATARLASTIGVTAPAYGVPQEIVDRFVEHIPAGTQTAVRMKPLAGIFNLARAKNRGVLELLDKCNIVVATDIDCLIPPGLLEVLPSHVQDGVAVWNPARNVYELNGDSWDEWKAIPLRKSGKGSFVAMTSDDWRRSGGFDERYCHGWGGEDGAFLEHREAMGIRTERLDYPLVHIMHPKRAWKGRRRSRRKRPEVPAEYTVNYLTGKVPRTSGLVMWVTSACPLSCEHCNQNALMQADPDYHMTPDDVGLLCECAEASDEPLGQVDITGGEPLSWKYLREGVAKLNECNAVNSIWVFTSGVGRDEDMEWLADNVDRIRLSRHPNNSRRVRALRRRLGGRRARVRIADKREHAPIPNEPVPGTLPGGCVCPSVCYTKGQIYICPNIATLLAQHGHDWHTNPGLIERIGPNFVDIRRHLGRSGANISWCALCVGNTRVASEQNHHAIVGA